MKNPCKECISLAICVSIQDLTCRELADYADHMWGKEDKEYWPYLTKYLPKLQNLYG